MLRIIAGTVKGKVLCTPRGQQTRPTAARVRESLFNILGAQVPDADFLDLFAGSGAIGLEALSRGARRVVFVESERPAWLCLEQNLSQTGLWQRASILRCDVRAALARLKKLKAGFDIVFLDPPYARGLVETVLPQLPALLKPGGVVVAEVATRADSFKPGEGFTLVKSYAYGDTSLHLLAPAEGGYQDWR